MALGMRCVPPDKLMFPAAGRMPALAGEVRVWSGRFGRGSPFAGYIFGGSQFVVRRVSDTFTIFQS